MQTEVFLSHQRGMFYSFIPDNLIIRSINAAKTEGFDYTIAFVIIKDKRVLYYYLDYGILQFITSSSLPTLTELCTLGLELNGKIIVL